MLLEENMNGAFSLCGAEGEARTPTGVLRLDPEPSASTSSATSAKRKIDFKSIMD